MISKVKELKPRKNRIDTIITATTTAIPIADQYRCIYQWCKAADRVIVHSNTPPPKDEFGLRYNPTKSENFPLADLFRAYVVQVPGAEIFAIAAPNVEFSPQQAQLFGVVADSKMERTWACHLTLPRSPVPCAFVLAAPILPHLLRDVPNNLNFESESWAVWLDGWLSSFMLQHRYFDGNALNLIGEPSKSAAIEPATKTKVSRASLF